MRTSVWLVRHGQTNANQQRRYQSWSDSSLTAYGQRQIAALARRLQRLPFDVALVSPTERTRATAHAILESHPTTTCIESPGWAELHHGRWEGLTYHEALDRYPDEAHARFADPAHGKSLNGESLAEVAQRVAVAWHDLQHRYPGGRVLVVTHATPIRLILCTTFNLPPTDHWHWRIDLSSVTSLDIYATGTIVRMVNEVPRL